MLRLLKAARRPLLPEWERFGLDRDGWLELDRLAHRLVRHLYFEHLSLAKIRDHLHQAVLRYRATNARARIPNREFAAETLDAMAQEPLHGTVFLGVEHLQLPHGTVVGGVRFVDPSSQSDLLESMSRFGRSIPSLLCQVEVTAGTSDLLRDRARDVAETALGLLRQQNLFGFNAKIYLGQILYRLDGRWALRNGPEVASAGWWRERASPIPMDLAHPDVERWREGLADLSALYLAVSSGLQARVDTCIDWLDVAALSDRWRIIIPAIFSGMEAILVPEMVGRKAEIVTVRSVAVHVALNHAFFDPSEIMAGYLMRSDLVHGTPIPNLLERDAIDFADGRRRWAFQVFRDYLKLATTIGADRAEKVVSHLDRGKCDEVCAWLEEHGGSTVVAQYREVVPRR